MDSNARRKAKLNSLFNDVVNGKRQIDQGTNLKQFLEAICAQDPLACLFKLSGGGLEPFRLAMCGDTKAEFYNGPVANILEFFAINQLTKLCEGSMMRTILVSITHPPVFWESILSALKANKLDEKGTFGFAWFLFQLIDLLPMAETESYRSIAADESVMRILCGATKLETRQLAEKIKQKVTFFNNGEAFNEGLRPGGRHNNDFADFQKIAIVPTADEIRCREPAFIRPSGMFEDNATKDSRQSLYRDNQFRLLREDMIYEIREELLMTEKKSNASRHFEIRGLKLFNIHHQPENGQRKYGARWTIVLQRSQDFPGMPRKNLEKRKAWLKDKQSLLKHQSMACLMAQGQGNHQELIALVTIERDEDFLAREPPRIPIRIEGDVVQALLKLKLLSTNSTTDLKLVQMSTALFAYEPVLRALQTAKSIPLHEELLLWDAKSQLRYSANYPKPVVDFLESNPNQDLSQLLQIAKTIKLDTSQSASLIMGLKQVVSLIQGPPGTGKSFIGALLAKCIHDVAQQKILVVCYTNHALDQFLEDLLDIGIPGSSMVRLGAKSTEKTRPFSLQTLQRSSVFKHSRSEWSHMNTLRGNINGCDDALKRSSDAFMSKYVGFDAIMEHLEFDDDEYYAAFTVPSAGDGEKVVDKKGKAINRYYLLDHWHKGWDAGVLKDHEVVRQAAQIWAMDGPSRRRKYEQWREAVLKDHVSSFYESAESLDRYQKDLDLLSDEKVRQMLASRPILACTTTAAAKYREQIHSANPTVVLVEEAGEILESHILTSLSPSVEKLILIGDHKQLRPKVNNFQLTVEKGEHYDLNRSLFERLVLKGYPHKTLSQQHRMRPEISELVRHLTYPELVDAPSTHNRLDIFGLQDNVVFVNHNQPEDDHDEFDTTDMDKNEFGSKLSKRNKHEVDMTLKIVRYLGQQGYGTEDLVILTPYLGQLRALQKELSKETDPILNDLDSADLVRAGLVTSAEAKIGKKPIRLATIDNYQGEESQIVIVSLTRSNTKHQIGFMGSPERVNVMLSRARDGLIMLGNAETYKSAQGGGKVWKDLFDLLALRKHMYDGLPVKCERHPDTTALLQSPHDFDRRCPDGGCTRPWY